MKYYIIKKSNPEFNLKDYQKELDFHLRKLGIDHNYLDKKNLAKILLKEKEAKSFIKENIPNQAENHDLVLDTITNLNAISDFMCKRYELMLKNNNEDNKTFSKSSEIFDYIADKLVNVADENHLIKLKENGVDLTEYLNVIEIQLNNLGITTNDILSESKDKDKIIKQLNEYIEKKLDKIAISIESTQERPSGGISR